MNQQWIAAVVSVPMLVAPVITSAAQAEPAALMQFFPALAGVQLTPQQQGQLETLTKQTLLEIESILTPTQRTQFNSALAAGHGIRSALSSLDLSLAQKLTLRHLQQSAQSQLAQTLTPAQQQQLRTNVQALQHQGH